MRGLDEQELIDRLRAGEEASFAHLIRKFGPRIDDGPRVNSRAHGQSFRSMTVISDLQATSSST